jgi:diadenosine tetraphosphatase ApaH/serine/threonine PP2A family protein phosphatase
MVINPGSTGNPTDGDNRCSYLVVSIDDTGRSSYMLRRVPYAIESTIKAAKEAGMPMVDQYAQALFNGTAM